MMFALVILILHVLRALGMPFPRILVRGETGVDSVDFKKTLHSSAALGAMTLLVTMHRALSSTGFTLTRRLISTDILLSISVSLLTAVWTFLVFASGYWVGDKPCAVGSWDQCLGRLAFIPWILLVMSGAWFIWLLDALIHQEARTSSYERIGLWQAVVDNGPFDWKSSLVPWYLWAIHGTIFLGSCVTAYGAVKNGDYTIAILNLAGFILVLAESGGYNPYTKAPHRYSADNIRIVLTTTHNSNTVYILPSRKVGFDAIHSPKIEYEHSALDKVAGNLFGTLFDKNPDSKWSATSTMFNYRLLAQDHNKNILRMSKQEIADLAYWIYWDMEGISKRDVGAMRKLACERTPKANLIGRELMVALMYVEYMLFELQERNRGRFPDDLDGAWTKLRSSRFSGASLANEKYTVVGQKPGKGGYQEAVRYVYGIFGLEGQVDESALNPTGKPPAFSKALNESPKDMDDYVAKLWDVARMADTTTFGALVLWTGVWYMEMGNVNGFHHMPLRPLNESKQGDLTVWNIIWRQAWYTGIVAQLVSMSPTIINAFLGGVLV